jgi:hypothetical protein
MYLHEIGELDQSWPSEHSNRSPLEHFHRQRTLRLLRAVVDTIGLDVYDALAHAYPGQCGSGCGFSKEEILSVAADAPLYERSDDFEPPDQEEPLDPLEELGVDDQTQEEWYHNGTPLHQAVRRGDLAAVQAQLTTQFMADLPDQEPGPIAPSLLNFQREGGCTALLDACRTTGMRPSSTLMSCKLFWTLPVSRPICWIGMA